MAADSATSIQQLAKEAYDCFTTKRRDGETEPFFTLKDDAPDWVRDLVYKAHHGLTDFLPDDYRYRWTFGALEFIQDSDSDDPEDGQHEFADLAVDTYTSDRIAWLASNLCRPDYCDHAGQEGIVPVGESIIDQIGGGQYMEASEVYGLVLKALEDVSAEVD